MASDALLGQDPQVPQLRPGCRWGCSSRRHTRMRDAAACGTPHLVHKDSAWIPMGAALGGGVWSGMGSIRGRLLPTSQGFVTSVLIK